MKWMTSEKLLAINHAGEWGAIHFYTAQSTVSTFRFPNEKTAIESILGHEKVHFKLFDDLLIKRKTRRCHALWFWKIGGYLLGFMTALLGIKAAMVATEVFEDVVISHFDQQLEWLKTNDNELHDLVSYVYQDELSHGVIACPYAEAAGIIYTPLRFIVRILTETMMLLAKHGI